MKKSSKWQPKGKYLLDVIWSDARQVWDVYSTNDYSLYYWYNILFYDYDVHIDPQLEREKKWEDYYKRQLKRNHANLPPPSQATPETWKRALEEERRCYECGFVPEHIKVKDKYGGPSWTRTIWVKNPEKAKGLLEKMKGPSCGALEEACCVC